MMSKWLALALLAASWQTLDGCSCRLEHPQSTFCRDDFDKIQNARCTENAPSTAARRCSFVIVGRVQKIFRGNEHHYIYKMKIRNIFKATPKARAVLGVGRILTPSLDSLCGVQLRTRETYVLTGRIVHAQARINLCNFYSKWRDVTPRQRKGFRLLYQQGCSCKVHMYRSSSVSPNSCVDHGNPTCYEKYGICLHGADRRCHWTRVPALKRCLQQSANKTMTMT